VDSAPRTAQTLIPDVPRHRLSLAIAVGCGVLMLGLGANQLAKDGSFWIDEASVALSLLELSPGELFGRLVGGQSFPRFLLLAIDGVVALFGYETLAARVLPHLFFALATIAWLHLLTKRFRDEPALLAAGALLLFLPATWFVYGAMLKPYSFDVMLAMAPFLLPDEFYEKSLADRGKRGRLLALTALGALSYPFSMALLARVGGWWIARAARGTFSVTGVGALTLALGMAAFGASIWLTDLRHTSGLGPALAEFWGRCIVGHEGTGTLALLDRFAIGWFDGRAEFSQKQAGLGEPALLVLRAGIVLGLLRIGASALLPALRTKGWESRSIGCALVLLGLPIASLLGGYPICAGRLTLFALLPIVIVVLEGFQLLADGLRRIPAGSWLAALGGALLVAWIAPASYRDTAALAGAPAPEDLRPLLAITRDAPQLPILTTSCTRKQLETLPEGVAATVLYIEQGGAIVVATSESREAWLLYAPTSFCRSSVARARKAVESAERLHVDDRGARLLRVRYPKPGSAGAEAQ